MVLKWLMAAAAALTISANASAQTSAKPVTLQARDGVSISGQVYEAKQPKAVILLFHQAGSSKAEYATIAPRLANAGYTALAIDQRSGGSLFGANQTASRLGKTASYEQAKPDLEAALDWAESQHLPIVLWGSSYSAALVFEVAAEHPDHVSAVVAFRPANISKMAKPSPGPPPRCMHRSTSPRHQTRTKSRRPAQSWPRLPRPQKRNSCRNSAYTALRR